MKISLSLISFKRIKSLFTKQNIKIHLKKIITLNASSSKIAFSIALGIFIGLMIPIGLQTIILLPIATLLGCNIILASSATLISNPLTIFPLYYSAIKIGEFLTGIKISWANFEKTINNPTWDNLVALGNDSLIVFFSGSFTEGIICAVIVYVISLYFIKRWRKKHFTTPQNLSENTL